MKRYIKSATCNRFDEERFWELVEYSARGHQTPHGMMEPETPGAHKAADTIWLPSRGSKIPVCFVGYDDGLLVYITTDQIEEVIDIEDGNARTIRDMLIHLPQEGCQTLIENLENGDHFDCWTIDGFRRELERLSECGLDEEEDEWY